MVQTHVAREKLTQALSSPIVTIKLQQAAFHQKEQQESSETREGAVAHIPSAKELKKGKGSQG